MGQKTNETEKSGLIICKKNAKIEKDWGLQECKDSFFRGDE